MKRATLILAPILLILVLSVIVACRGPLWDDGSTGSSHLIVRASKFTLTWDCTAYGAETCPRPVERFQIYYRRYGSAFWILLAEVSGEGNRTYTVDDDVLPAGRYEFAVRNVYEDGRISPFHSSGDFNSDPPGGWFVDWIPTL